MTPPTPRTDAAIERIRNARWFSGDIVSPEFARQLERELVAAETALQQAHVLRKALEIPGAQPPEATAAQIRPATVEFTIDDMHTLHSNFHQDIRAAADHYWNIALREWFEQYAGGMPSTEDLRKNARWLIPQPDGLKIMEKHFQWHGQVILTGYLDTTDGMHKIHPTSIESVKTPSRSLLYPQ